MAEARRAVEPLPSLTLEQPIDPTLHVSQCQVSQNGLSIFIPHPRFIVRNISRTIKQGIAKMHQAFMPLPLPAVFSVVGGAVTVVMMSPSTGTIRNGWLGNLLWNLDSMNPLARRLPVAYRVGYLTFNAGILVIFAFTAAHRMLLRGLLSYHGYMFEGSKKSLKTKVWGFLLKYLYIRGGSKVTQAYQTSLPTFPLPKLEDTVKRYMNAMEGLFQQDPEERTVVAALAEQFVQQEGKKLQRYLGWKHLISRNYISDWWLDVVYLRGRDSIMINSNYYGLSTLRQQPTMNQASRAAYVTYQLALIHEEIQKEKIAPTLMQRLVPLCMQQYRLAFRTTRVPGLETDHLLHTDAKESRHIVVLHKGKFYKVKLYSDVTGRRLSYTQFFSIFEGILNDASSPTATELESNLCAFTAWDRSSWAQCREKHFLRNRMNRTSLDIIEKAMWFAVLDDGEESTAECTDLTKLGRIYMHGSGSDRWFDKSFNAIFAPNGYYAMNGEHAWADAPCLGHILELVLAREVRLQPYLPDGSLKADPNFDINLDRNSYAAERLNFVSTPELVEASRTAVQFAKNLIADLDLVVRHHSAFGKGRLKKSGLSPDAFIQLSLQVAFFRDQKKFVQTYESALARLFLEGRTETIRACTEDSCNFVKALLGGKADKAELQALARKSCETHGRNTALAMTGKGVDRHLFALYVVAIGTHTESPFLRNVMKRGWKLSTSQVPTWQTDNEWPTKDNGDQWPRPSGGFGPVADDGYGVSYAISGENNLFFHVSSKKSSSNTNSARLLDNIFQAMQEIVELF
jgi:carnitine O-palmitoyltransferase 1